MNQTDYDIIIVGAGIGGLETAKQLIFGNPDLKIAIFEKFDQIGGRVQTTWIDSASGKESETGDLQIDHGAAWVHGMQNQPLMDYLEKDDLIEIAGGNPWNNPWTIKDLDLFEVYDAETESSLTLEEKQVALSYQKLQNN